MIPRMLAFALALTFGIAPVAAEENIVKSPPIMHVQLSFNKLIKAHSLATTVVGGELWRVAWPENNSPCAPGYCEYHGCYPNGYRICFGQIYSRCINGRWTSDGRAAAPCSYD
jgi:hypothetical protein